MRTQTENPAYRRFGHLLPSSGLYPAKWVDIFSNLDRDFRYDEVEVVFVPRGVDSVDLDREFWDEFGDYIARWEADLGNSVAGWMSPQGLNPEKVFGGMLAYGFSTEVAMTGTITEFAWIQECEWARQMQSGVFPELLAAFTSSTPSAAAALNRVAQHTWARDMLTALDHERHVRQF